MIEKKTRREVLGELFAGLVVSLLCTTPWLIKFAEQSGDLDKKTELKPREKIQESSEALPIAWMPETVLRWSFLIKEIANQYQIDPNLVTVIILCESGGNFAAVSSSGAIGLMQVMPFNALGINLFIPKSNISQGVRYLATQYNRFNDWNMAITAYNSGPGNVLRGTIPFESKRFLKWVGGMWAETYKNERPTFQEWLAYGGNGLVEKARQLYENDTRLRAVEFATQQWGKPYRWGGNGPEFWDGSDLVRAAYHHAGIEIPRTADEQWQTAGRFLTTKEEPLPGDLVFFTNNGRTASHVGMIIFPPSVLIEATAIDGKVRISSLNPESQIYRKNLGERFLGLKRLVE